MSVTAAPRTRLRVACISTYGGHGGGAAVAMQRLAAALEAEGATVDVMTRDGPEPAAGRRVRRRIRHGRTPLSNTLFSADWPSWDIASLPAVVAADVVHVHWVAGFLDAAAVCRLVATGKPVVWTQHDLRAFTGGCHYPAGCRGFTADCRSCPQLAARLAALPERTLRRSRRLLRGLPLTFVAPSRWLAEELRTASLFDPPHHSLHVIPNGIDLDRYVPAIDKPAARALLGLPATGLAVLLGSVSLDERRKGARAAATALALLAERLRAAGAPPPVAVTYGAGAIALPGIAQHHLGSLAEPGVIAALHASDVHLTMTREDNLPNTVVEALACGLPVVGSAVGGVPEMLTTGVEGWLVAPDDPAAAATALARLAQDPGLLAETGRAARRRAVAAFDARVQARRHLALYGDLPQRAAAIDTAAPGVRLLPPTPATVPLIAPPPLVRTYLRHLRRLSR
jgi:glycosyltransferase involved in cell wall biosynthesis